MVSERENWDSKMAPRNAPSFLQIRYSLSLNASPWLCSTREKQRRIKNASLYIVSPSKRAGLEWNGIKAMVARCLVFWVLRLPVRLVRFQNPVEEKNSQNRCPVEPFVPPPFCCCHIIKFSQRKDVQLQAATHLPVFGNSV